MSEGPSLWTSAPINLRAIVASFGGLLPGASLTGESQLGLDYIPPLNARADIKAPVRAQQETKTLLASTGLLSLADIPERFSWNDLNSIQTVKGWTLPHSPLLPPPSQYSCGSCWAWASAGMLSDRYAIFTGDRNPNLSPTFLISCVSPTERCNGGFPADAGLFLEKQGIPGMQCWDYSWCSNTPSCVAGRGSASSIDLNKLVPSCSDGQCRHNCEADGKNCATGGEIQFFKARAGSTQALTDRRSIQLDILQNGPVVAVYRVFGDFVAGSMAKTIYPQADGWEKTRNVYVHVTGKDIYQYGEIDCLGAKQSAPDCFMGNHAVVIVGWGIERAVPNFLNSKGPPLDLPYWIVRNSWGPTWNGNGYFRIAMSDPDTGVNMAVAIDRPVRINGVDFGAVTTWMPNVDRGQHIRDTVATASAVKWKVRVNLTIVLVILGVLLLLAAVLVWRLRHHNVKPR